MLKLGRYCPWKTVSSHLKTEILTLEIVTCKLLLLARETYNVTIFSIQVCLRDIFYMKVDHHSYRRNFCSCWKNAWKNFRLLWNLKVASITTSLTAMIAIIYFHIILHPAVHIYNCDNLLPYDSSPRSSHICLSTSVNFSWSFSPSPPKVNWCLRLLISFFFLPLSSCYWFKCDCFYYKYRNGGFALNPG